MGTLAFIKNLVNQRRRNGGGRLSKGVRVLLLDLLLASKDERREAVEAARYAINLCGENAEEFIRSQLRQRGRKASLRMLRLAFLELHAEEQREKKIRTIAKSLPQRALWLSDLIRVRVCPKISNQRNAVANVVSTPPS